MNFRVDVMIVGDSKSGHDILDKIAVGSKKIKIAFISQAFKSTTTHDYLNVQYFRDRVEHVSYKHRLFCCYLKNGDNIFSTHLILAPGLVYEPFMINGKQINEVLNSSDDVTNNAKDSAALVVCNQESDVKFAIDVAKKYKQTCVCAKDINLVESLPASTAKKLAKAENIKVFPNASIKSVISNNNEIQKVELDDYSEISCSAIYAKTAATPAIDFIPRKIVARVENYPDVKDNCESLLVPNCFVIGSCLKKYTKPMEQRVVEAVLNYFN